MGATSVKCLKGLKGSRFSFCLVIKAALQCECLSSESSVIGGRLVARAVLSAALYFSVSILDRAAVKSVELKGWLQVEEFRVDNTTSWWKITELISSVFYRIPPRCLPQKRLLSYLQWFMQQMRRNWQWPARNGPAWLWTWARTSRITHSPLICPHLSMRPSSALLQRVCCILGCLHPAGVILGNSKNGALWIRLRSLAVMGAE